MWISAESIFNLQTAARAYKQALSTLSYVNVHSYHTSNDGAAGSYASQGYQTSMFSAFLPTIQGHGPIASATRILMKLRHQSWVPSFVTNYLGKEFGGGKKKDEELHGKAIKVLDLLQHAAELGHEDALYTLARISLVRPTVIALGCPNESDKACSPHRIHTFHSTLYLATTRSHRMQRLPGTRPLKRNSLSSTRLGTNTSYQ